METNGDLGRLRKRVEGRLRAEKLWGQLSYLLNSIAEGVSRKMEKWIKIWADWKAKIKNKAAFLIKKLNASGSSPWSGWKLTATEQRVLVVLGELLLLSRALIFIIFITLITIANTTRVCDDACSYSGVPTSRAAPRLKLN